MLIVSKTIQEIGKSNRYIYDQPSVLLGRKGTIDKPQFIEVPFWTVDTAYFTDIFPTTNKKYFFYLCLTINFDFYKYGSAVPSLTQETLSQIPFTAPPLQEQNKIACYLDHKTTEIDQLIAQKERLIELYEEEKTAIINQAVTKGINPDVKLKPSGIDWLGDIPEHWQQVPFRWCCYITEGQVDPTDSQFRQLPLIAPNHIESQTGKLIQKETAEEQGAISGKYFYKSGTLLYSKIRPALVKACIADEDGLCSADMYPIITKNNLLPKFMLYQILSKGFTQLAKL